MNHNYDIFYDDKTFLKVRKLRYCASLVPIFQLYAKS